MKSIGRKILIIFLTSALVFNVLIFPKKAEALVVWDPGNWIANLGSWIWSKVSGSLLDSNWWEEKLNKSLRDVVAKKLLDYVVDQTVKWIQGGGKPKFITDWKGFLQDAGNIAFDQVLKDVGLAWLCQPFSLQVKLSLLPSRGFSQRIECTLDDVVGNIENFYQDFSQGGWIAYQEMWQPQNNYFGQLLMIHDEVLEKTAEKVEAAKNEALAGSGFLSSKKCVLYDDWTGECIKEKIVTPGSTVGEVVAEAITTDIEWAANIESWTSALVNAVINRLISEGIGLMKGSAESHGSYYPREYDDLFKKEFENQKNKLIDQVEELVDEWQYLFNIKTASLSYVEALKPILLELQSRGCPSLQNETRILPTIQANQADIDRLKTETNWLKNRIKEGDDLITAITNAKTYDELQAIAGGEYLAFKNKYNTPEMQGQILTGDARKAADQEKQNKTADFAAAKARLAVCAQMQTPTSTQP